MKYLALFLLFFVNSSAFCQSQQKNEQITVNGLQRTFVTYIPASGNNEKLPVIFSLHGRLGSGENMMRFADFRPIADKEKFIIVCPDGINKSWNDGRETPAHKKGIDDVKFIDQLITYILNTYHGDAGRVYVTGMSNGGFMTSRLACELNKRIAAVAVVAASMDTGMDYQPKPMPVMYIQGTKDPLVPFEGGNMKSAHGEIYSHEDALKVWADAAHITNKPTLTNIPDNANDGTSIVKEEYGSGTGKIKVIGYSITNGGHTWPGGSQYLPKFIIGSVSHNMNACEVIWAFFKGYRLGD